jgi:hypothetical protein
MQFRLFVDVANLLDRENVIPGVEVEIEEDGHVDHDAIRKLGLSRTVSFGFNWRF